MLKRKITRTVNVGGIAIGGGNPIVIQSMCNTDTRDIDATVKQITELANEGCQIVRVAVVDMEAAKAIGEIKKHISIPLVADIHFDYRLAVEAMEQGVDKVRINPGNIGSREKVKAVVDTARKKHIPIRIGVNSGSLEKELLQEYGKVTPQDLVKSAMKHVRILEEFDFHDIIISIKASDVPMSIETYTLLSENCNYPIHLGITEAGTVWGGTIKSAVGIGAILSMGIGDTVRVSLTGDPVEEVRAAKEILKSLGLGKFVFYVISCPTFFITCMY